MKKGQIFEGKIERIEFPNKGIAVIPGEEKNVIVKNTVEGQKVQFAVNKIKKVRQRADCWKCWKNHRWKQNRHVHILETAEGVHTRIFHMRISFR